MARKRAKGANADEDRISALPDPVIYHILSFVPTVYSVRMSVVSRRWRRIWHSVPTLLFPFRDGFQCTGAFNAFVEICLKHRKRATRFVAGSSVTSFELDTCYSQEQFAGLSGWFHSSVVMNNVKKMDVILRQDFPDYRKKFSLPSAVLNGRSLTRLKLEGSIKISASCSVNLPSLKYLSLNRVKIGTEVLRNLVFGCPIVEECVVRDIQDIENLRISSLSLKFLEVDIAPTFTFDATEMKIEAVNLTSLVMRCYCDIRYDFSALRAVKYLKIRALDPYHFRNFEGEVSKLHQLEDLTLGLHCEDGLFVGNLTISNQNLKHCSVFGVDFRVTMETPRLVSFNYSGNTEFALSMSMWATNAIGQFSVLSPDNESGETNWHSELITFLSNVNCSWKSVCLNVEDDKDLMVPKNLRTTCDPPLPNLKHLKVVTRESTTRKSELRKSLQWLCPSLETLSIEKDPKMCIMFMC